MRDAITRLSDNPITPADHRRLESYGAYLIRHGVTTRYAWAQERGDPRFDIFRGGAEEWRAARIGRDRERHAFFAVDDSGTEIVAGTLEHVMAGLERYLHDDATTPPPGA